MVLATGFVTIAQTPAGAPQAPAAPAPPQGATPSQDAPAGRGGRGQEPTAIAFDGHGRMFVLEDRGYMQDVDATGEHDPNGRISMHADTNNDGVYDKHTVFVDNMVFPRVAIRSRRR